MIEVKQEHLQFDRAHLEWAILNQASLFDLYASECARQQSKVDKIKNALEYKTAEKKTKVRADVAAAGGKVPTQDQVDCAVILDPDIKLLKDNLLRNTSDSSRQPWGLCVTSVIVSRTNVHLSSPSSPWMATLTLNCVSR